MPIVGLSPTWTVKKGLGSLPTCDIIWNAKTTLWNNSGLPRTWTTEPAYEGFQSQVEQELDSTLDTARVNPYPFTIMPSPGLLSKSILFLDTNSMSVGFQILLGRDGPTVGATSNVAIEERLIFNIPPKSDPAYPTSKKFLFPSGTSSGDTVVPLFGGHSYGFIFKSLDGEIPSGSLDWSISTVFHFGGAGS